MKKHLHFIAFSLLSAGAVQAQGIYNFYGMTFVGGTNNGGTIIKTASDGSNARQAAAFTMGSTGTGFNPQASLIAYNGKLYGATAASGSASTGGAIIEFNPATATITRRATFTNGTSGIGTGPRGALALYDDMMYINTQGGGANSVGAVVSFDPATGALTNLFSFFNSSAPASAGYGPQCSYVRYNNKLYSPIAIGGGDASGTIVELNPLNSGVVKRADFTTGITGTGRTPWGKMIVYNNKMYGMTQAGGANFGGTIYEYDPATTFITNLASLNRNATDGRGPYGGSLVVYNNVLYGLTPVGGTANGGTIMAYDLTTGALTKVADFTTATGITPYGGLTLFKNKLYGMTYAGGTTGQGAVFEFDPATGILTKKSNLNATTGYNPEYVDLLVFGARPAAGTLNACEIEPSITSANGTDWLPVYNSINDAVAEVNPNGNDLGGVSVTLFARNTTLTIREDASHKMFLDRNVTISSSTPPATPAGVRIYITEAEYQHLKTSTSTLLAPSGINSPADLQLFVSSGACPVAGAVPDPLTPLATTVEVWEGGGYVLTAQTAGFGTFFAGAKIITPLPLGLTGFSAKLVGDNDVLLAWQVLNPKDGKEYIAERSADGQVFSSIGHVKGDAATTYSLHDRNPLAGRSYYRLRMVDIDGRTDYSRTELISINGRSYVHVAPSPAKDHIVVETNAMGLSAVLSDIQGRVLLQFAVSNGMKVDVSLFEPGMYLLRMSDGQSVKIVKE